MKSIFRALFFVCACICILPGCHNKDKQRQQVFFEKAQECFDQRDYVCARDNLHKAIDINPEFASAYASLGETYLRLGDVNSAFSAFEKAVNLDPDNSSIQNKLATLYLLQGDFREAKRILNGIMNKHENNLSALSLMAGLHTREHELEKAARLYKKITEINPSRERAYTAWANIAVRQGEFQSAEKILKKGIEQNPKSLNLHLAIYQLHFSANRHEKAEAALKKALSLEPDDPKLHMLLANLYAALGEREKADEAFHRAIKTNPHNIKSYLAAASFYENTRELNKALSMYRKALELQPENIGLMLALSDFYIGSNRLEQASNYINQALKKNPGYLPARLLKARLLIKKKDYSNAISLYKKIRQNFSEPEKIDYLQALAHLKADELNAAKTSLAKIGPKSSEYVSARLLMARIYYLERNFTQAEEACRNALEASPGNIQVLSMLGEIHINQQDYQKAEQLFTRIIEISPHTAAGYYNLGIVRRLRGEREKAVSAFQSALSSDPKHTLAFVNLVEVLIEQSNLEKAIAVCDERIQKFPENSKLLAPVYNLKGRVMMLMSKPAEAERLFKKALIENENYLPPYYSLANLYVHKNKAREAIAQFENTAENKPEQVMPHMMLGILNSLIGRRDTAMPHYRKALEINPYFVAAANNLAYALAEENKDLNQALELAKRAKDQMPDDPRVADTLGWVYYKMGLYDSAIREFSASMEKLPGNPTVQYHIGMAYFKKGDKRRAKTALEKALELDENFANSEEARKILTEIGKIQTG